ncbi:hypothetical protein ISS96_02005 [Candidatus Bathyarchaeota archaeon]|nr:hypothetical protein [Candidatus Bathyarchaeota archaeon]
MGKIFRSDGKTLIVAMDHGLGGPRKGIESPRETIQKIVDGEPDSIIVNLGILREFSKELKQLPSVMWNVPLDEPSWIQESIKLGVDGVKIGCFQPLSNRAEFMKMRRIGVECEKWGMPMCAEPIPVDPESRKPITDLETNKIAARLGAEVGGDFLKLVYTGSRKTFKEVVDTCVVPATIMGGVKMETEREVLEVVKGMIDAGGCGVAFGRNIWQHKDPAAMIRAISRIIHGGVSVEKALQELE